MKKFILSCLLSALCLPPTYAVDYSGTCGANLTWDYNQTTNTLTIQGSGQMDDYTTSSLAPWVYNINGDMTIIINEGVTSIGEYAFLGTANIRILNISLPSTLVSIGKDAFLSNQSLNSIVIPDNVTKIGAMAFMGCVNLSSVKIGNSVTNIGDHAFCNCPQLTSITIPNSVTTIGSSAFSQCTSLSDLTLGTSILSIPEGCFQDCNKLSSVVIPNSVSTIGSSSFSGNSLLSYVKIGSGIISIGLSAFYECRNLKKITIDATVPPSLNYSFWQTGLDTVYVPCSSVEAYQQAKGWSGYTIIGLEENCKGETSSTKYSISVLSNNTSMGSVSGGGEYEEGATATVTATPKSGYKFTKWSDGSKKNPYSFTVTKDITLTAYFEKKEDASTSTFWNFSDDAFKSLGTISSSKTINGLTINATSSKNVVIDASSQSIDNIAFTHRLKLNGAGDASARSLKFNVDGDCTIDIYLKSGSSSEDRTLRIDFGSFGSNNKKTITASKSSITKETLTYSGAATSVFVYGTGSGVNLYGIRVTTTSSSTDPIEISCAEAVQIASSLDHNKPTTNIYTVTGFVTETDGKVSKGQQIFWMADTQDGGKVFECYWGNVPEVVVVGDEVAVTGNLLRYNSTYEIKNGTVEILSRAQGIDNLQDAPCVPHKILRDGQVLILRGDKTYTIQGQEVK